MNEYYKKLKLHCKVGLFLMGSGICVMLRGMIPFFKWGPRGDIHYVINKVAFIYTEDFHD